MRNSWKAYSRENTPNGSRSNVNSNRLQRSASPASIISNSDLKSSSDRNSFSSTPIARKLFPASSPCESGTGNRSFSLMNCLHCCSPYICVHTYIQYMYMLCMYIYASLVVDLCLNSILILQIYKENISKLRGVSDYAEDFIVHTSNLDG